MIIYNCFRDGSKRLYIEEKLSNPIPSREIGFLYNSIQPFNENILKFINDKTDII